MGWWSQVPASTVLPMSLSELADAAAQVVEGTVISIESEWVSDGRSIATTLLLDHVVYHKGHPFASEAVFELVIPGGQVDGTRVVVSDAPQFATGQRWILFLHRTYRMHPVVGLYHGAFQVRRLDGVDVVHNASGMAVVGIDRAGIVQSTRSTAGGKAPSGPGTGIELGAASTSIVDVVPIAEAVDAGPMSYSAFLDALAPVLAGSRDHAVTGPAGRFEPADGPPNPTGRIGKPLHVRNATAIGRPHRRTDGVRTHDNPEDVTPTDEP